MRDENKVHYVVFHQPGENWVHGVDFRQQPGEHMMAHVQHYGKFHAEGKLQMGGPFLLPDGGGMMIATEDISEDELRAFAADDPAVKAGVLTFEIRPWYVPMKK